MIKFSNIGDFKVVRNIGYATCTSDLKNGMGVTVSKKTSTLALPTADTAKGEVWIVMSTINTPEIDEPNDFVIKAGTPARVFDVKTMTDVVLEFDTDEVTTAYADLAVDDTLGFGTDGKMVKLSATTGYATYFKILKKTSFGNGEGIVAEIVVA